jgi:lysophospholipase L1-like esterase
MNFFLKYLKFTYINLIIIFLFIILLEIIFGYWFKKNNFGIHMRAERNRVNKISTNHDNGDKINFTYKRNFYGFIGDEFNPKDVKIVFEGGSTGAEIWKPEEKSIVGVLNKLFLKDNIQKKIYNASINGKSIRGYTYDHKNWFSKIPNFKPQYIIYYLGINDRKFPDDEQHRFYDEQSSTIISKKIRDYIKNNSFIFEKIKKIKNKYFIKNYDMYDMNKEKLYQNFVYIDYNKANKIHSKILTKDEENYITLLNLRLNNLNEVIKKNDFIPIFITQIKFDGLSDRNLFIGTKEIKKFVKSNNYKIIPLDELITTISINDFFDEVHTTISGSEKIAKVIYKYLIKIIDN